MDLLSFDRIAILGATGPTGRHLQKHLAERLPDVAVRVVSRSESTLKRRFAGADLEIVPADASKADELLASLEGCDLVFDCIGLPADQMPLHSVISRHIAQAVRETDARAVQISSYWAYLPVTRLPLDESHPRTGGGPWVQERRAAEDILQGAGAAVLHLPDFYGPYVHTSTLQNALAEAAEGEPMNWIGGPQVERAHIYVPDAMRVAMDLAMRPEAYGERWMLPGAGPLTGSELERMVTEALGSPAKLRPASPALLRIVSLFNKDLRAFMQMVPHYARPLSFDASRLEKLIGAPELTPYSDGIPRTLEWLRFRDSV